jgi:hypothetical protein
MHVKVETFSDVPYFTVLAQATKADFFFGAVLYTTKIHEVWD